jgi:hypothetical protein
MHPRAGLRFAARRAYLCTRLFFVECPPRVASAADSPPVREIKNILQGRPSWIGMTILLALSTRRLDTPATRMRAALMAAEVYRLLRVRLSLVMLVRK